MSGPPAALNEWCPLGSGAEYALLAMLMVKTVTILMHTWLPDAMEGPTAVSAIIHAATLVVAGLL